MRRIVCREFGPPDGLRLEEAADPRPGPGEVVIGVRAAGVSFVDGAPGHAGIRLGARR